MKKILTATIVLMFVLTLGTAYAADYNGITDFFVKSYEELASACFFFQW